MHGDIATAAKWLCLGMVLSTLILVAGTFCVVHGEALLNRGAPAPTCTAMPELTAPAATN